MTTRRKFSTVKVGRDARTGLFIPVETAHRRKASSIVETITVARNGWGEFVTTARRIN